MSIYDDRGQRITYCQPRAGYYNQCNVTAELAHQISVDTATNKTRTFTGYVSQDVPAEQLPSTDVRAVSNTVSVQNTGWSGTVGLQISRSLVDVQNSTATVTVTSTSKIAGPYYLSIYDDRGQRITYCQPDRSYTNPCNVTADLAHQIQVNTATNATRTFTGYVSLDVPAAQLPSTGVRAVSNTVWVRNTGWHGTVTLTRSPSAYPNTILLTATTSANITGPYYLSIYDDLGQLVASCERNIYYYPCQTARSHQVGVTVTPGQPRTYTAYVSQAPDNGRFPSLDVRAISGLLSTSGQGPTEAGELDGGFNPSGHDSARCHCDPVNSATGEFFETDTDLTLPGVGAPLGVQRSFSTARRDLDGAFGHGWSLGLGMSLAPETGSSGPLADALQIKALQENGSVVVFTRGPNGYTAPARVNATLTRNSDGTFVLARQHQQWFTFNPGGVLIAVADQNGQGYTLTYGPTGRLSTIQDGRGRELVLTWTGAHVSTVRDHTGRTVTYTYSSAGDLIGVEAPDGALKQYTYDDQHRVLALTAPDGGVTTNEYDTANRVTQQTDPLGRATTFGYGNGQTTITDPDGSVTVEKYLDLQLISETKAAGTPLEQTTVFTYDITNQVASRTDALGRITRFTYDADGNRTSVTDSLARVSTSTYDEFGNPLTVSNAAGETTTFNYDDRGNLATSTGPDGATSTYVVNGDGTIASVTDALGRTTAMTYDAHGFLTAMTAPDGAVATSTFDTLGRQLSSTSPLGNVPGADQAEFTSTFTYDAAGRQLTGTDPMGATSTVTYDPAGRPVTMTDPAGALTGTEYDLAGQVLAAVDAAGNRTTFTYDAAGRILTVTDADGKTTTRGYDALGRLVSMSDPLGRVVRTEYDAGNRVTATITPSGARTTYTYDAADQVLSITDALGHTTTSTYDEASRPVKVTDADGRAVTTSYDNDGRPTQVLRGDGSTLTWQYDPVGQLLHAGDATGATTTYAYDTAGRATSFTDTAGRTTGYAYDADGHLTTTTQPGGAVTTFAYDGAGRRTSTDYSDATPDVTVSYDPAGRLTDVTDGAGSTTYTRDVLGRVTQVDRAGTMVGYAYDDLGRLTTLTYPNGDQVQHGYDAAGQLTTVTDWADREFTYDYTENGQLAALTYPNGVVTNYQHDTTGQTLAITTQNQSGQGLLDLAYGYSDAGLLTDQDTSRPGDPRAPPASDTTTASDYTWDTLGRLAEITGTGAGTLDFDSAGSVTALPDGRTLTYDTHRQLTTMTTPDGGATTYGYDARGNRTTASTSTAVEVTHGFDQANRLTAITNGGTTTTYTYDAAGLRTSATTGDDVETYVWDTLAGVPLLLTDTDHTYVYGNGTAPLDQIDTTTGAVDYLHTDLTGSVRTTTDATGHVTADSDYDPFGKPQTVTGATSVAGVTRFGYAGEYTDPTGYLYLRGRYYDPTTAQFLSVDPLLQSTADPYGYTGGNPLQYTDPLGLDWLDDTSNWVAGFGDALTFGATAQVRRLINYGLNGETDDMVDHCSDFYEWGGYGGIVASFVPIGGGGARAIAWAASKAPRLAAAVTAVRVAMKVKLSSAAAAVGTRLVHAFARMADDTGSADFFARAGAGAANTADELASIRFRSETSHIFRDKAGHLLEDTAENRSLIQDAVSPENLRRTTTLPDGTSIARYFKELPDGTQSWAEVRNGTEITNGGLNVIPR
ncbi:RHS repeat-associated core domain-containing protein [Cellulomonas sp. URHD0024]|uniref:RHS repeat-associated core domain-containing protein n=1 Tax=Cellulomonas sp. URHD0024 TaxID=1302620 RepID=UPI000424637E|nr:RHS repeat-associated core domain-containing protein [Cellulomonas sp. URHD0024]